jgi:hypothetical protein
VIAIGSGAIGAIPLPSLGGVAVTDLSIAEQTGYLVVHGNVQYKAGGERRQRRVRGRDAVAQALCF